MTTLPDDVLQRSVVNCFWMGFRNFILPGCVVQLWLSRLHVRGRVLASREAAAWRVLWLTGTLLHAPGLSMASLASAAQVLAGMQAAAPCSCPALSTLACMQLFRSSEIWLLLGRIEWPPNRHRV